MHACEFNVLKIQVTIRQEQHREYQVGSKESQRTEEPIKYSTQHHRYGHHIGLNYFQHRNYFSVCKITKINREGNVGS